MKTKTVIALTALASILTLVLILAACNSDAADPDLPLQQIFQNNTSDGKIYRLTITQNTARTAFTPAHGDTYVLEIIENGEIVNTSSGTVQAFTNNTITLQPSNNEAENFTVQVNNEQIVSISGPIAVEGSNTPVTAPPSDKFATVTGVTVTPSTAMVARNGTQQFTAVVAGTNNPAQTVTWTVTTDTGNVNGTTISAAGLLSVGPNQNPTTLIVRATSTVDTTKSGAASVTVPNPGNSGGQIAVTGVSLNKTALNLPAGGTETLIAAVTPGNASNKDVTWTSSAAAVATVNSGGLVTAVSAGTATITVTTADGGKTAACSVTVYIGGHDGTQGLAFTLINNGAAYSVSAGTVNSGPVVIPATYNGKPVTEIANLGFFNKSITSVTIPTSVTTIDINAFQKCANLANIIIPASVTTIGNGAFLGCTSLTSVTLSTSLKSINDSVFRECNNLTSITIPSSVTSIGPAAFYQCTSLTSITFAQGSQLTSIGDAAFSICTNLTSIGIPTGVTYIGGGAFAYCDNLTSVTIPSSVKSIESGAFADCKSLTSITIPGGLTFFGERAFGYCTSLATVTILAGVTSISNGAFDHCPNLTSVNIPSSVTSIGSESFSYCSSLANITIPPGLTSIGYRAFSYCTSITSVTIPSSVSSIATSAFIDWRNYQTINIQGQASQASADAAWGTAWRGECNATINYLGQ